MDKIRCVVSHTDHLCTEIPKVRLKVNEPLLMLGMQNTWGNSGEISKCSVLLDAKGVEKLRQELTEFLDANYGVGEK